MNGYDNTVVDYGREFVRHTIAPLAHDADENEAFSIEAFREMGKFGLFGAPYPERYGGTGLDYTTYAGLIREVAKACASSAMTAVAHATLTCGPIYSSGSEFLKEKFLPPLLRGERVGAFAMTEPDAGSDISAIQARADKDGNDYVLNGSKIFITNANVADLAVVVVKTGPRAGLLGLSLFAVEKGTPGFSASGRHERKLGMRGSDTGELVFRDARVPKKNLIGLENRGFEILQQTLAAARLDMAAIALGIAEAARDLCLDYALQRKQFGNPLQRFQLIRAKLADMEVGVSAADALVSKGLKLRDEGKPFFKEASEAKLFASEMAVAVTKDAIQIHGGYGYCRDFPLERFFRDAKLTEIGDGTSEIQRLLIADEALKARAACRAGAAA
ncbi:MAG: acyl-CoA dehydrogenase family protein [Terracidiphilus sp.]|jgi:alkylation response protein AidB-like acyl-CoA dehydrogenase